MLKNVFVGVALRMLLVGFLISGSAFGGEAGLAQKFTVLTQNMWGLPSIFVKNKKTRMAEFCEALKERVATGTAWDSIFLQEVWMMRDQALLKDCGYPYQAMPDRHLWDSGLVILSKYPILEQKKIRYDIRHEYRVYDAEAFAHKAALLALVEHPTLGKIWLVTTHLASGDNIGHANVGVRSTQLEQLAEAVQALPVNEAIIMGGDLNTGEGYAHDESWDTVLRLFPDFKEAAYDPTVCTYCPPNTYVPPRKYNGKIDHLFASPLLVPVRGGVAMTEKFYNRRGRKLINYSDHYGWETAFEPKSAPAVFANE